jgi:SAM-dependent methyltransferase
VYEHSASLVYDRLNASRKDYRAEAIELAGFIRGRIGATASLLLDVGCGTGRHGEELRQLGFDYVGVDLSPEILTEAKKRLPSTRLIQSDIRSLSLEDRFDVVMCLNATIGYMLTRVDLAAALHSLTKHVRPGGIVLLEPWASREQWLAPRVSVETLEEPDLAIARVSRAYFDGEHGAWEWQCAVATPDRSWSFTEVHVLGLWEIADYTGMLSELGYEATHAPMASGRGLGIIVAQAA